MISIVNGHLPMLHVALGTVQYDFDGATAVRSDFKKRLYKNNFLLHDVLFSEQNDFTNILTLKIFLRH